MSNDRLYVTDKERLAQEAFGMEGTMLSMNENTIDNMINRERTAKFNNEYEAMQENLEKHNEDFKDSQASLTYDAVAAEIKPLGNRILVKPFKVNPFQRLVRDDRSGIILDSGGYNPHTQLNPITGKYEEQEATILVGEVIEIGPECKYTMPGDAVFYHKGTSLPVPFLKSGIYTVNETQVLAIVNEHLTERFENGK